MRTLSSEKKSLIHLVVIFSLIGFKNEEAGGELRFQLKEVCEVFQREFDDTFKISHVIEMDCRNRQSDSMKDCRAKLKKIREEMLKVRMRFLAILRILWSCLQTAEGVPKLCQAIEEYLSLPDEKRKKPLAYFLTTEEFEIGSRKKLALR